MSYLLVVSSMAGGGRRLRLMLIGAGEDGFFGQWLKKVLKNK
jgi:hypothetical protein